MKREVSCISPGVARVVASREMQISPFPVPKSQAISVCLFLYLFSVFKSITYLCFDHSTSNFTPRKTTINGYAVAPGKPVTSVLDQSTHT